MSKVVVSTPLEPVWGDQQANQADLAQAFQWYNLNRDATDSRQYLIDYIKSNIPAVNVVDIKIHNPVSISLGWLARMLSRGVRVDDKTMLSFNNKLKAFLSEISSTQGKAEEPVIIDNVVNIQDRIQGKTDQYIAELEGVFDDFFFNKAITTFDAYKWLIDNNVKAIHSNKIAEYFNGLVDNLTDVIHKRKSDPYIKESYPRSDKDMKNAIAFLSDIVTAANRLASNTLATRKPRKKKAVSLEKRIAKLNYKKEDTEFNVKSINPIKILSAEKLWVFNVKTRKLGVYVAADGAGLSVKGSKIENYKYSESIAKTLRKPKETLSRVLDGGKVVLRKVMGEINSKPQQLNGSINKDTIILRIE